MFERCENSSEVWHFLEMKYGCVSVLRLNVSQWLG